MIVIVTQFVIETSKRQEEREREESKKVLTGNHIV